MSTGQKIIIAIDGHSSCGKSTLAKDMAKALGYVYIDTGAMYRAITLYFLDHEIDYTKPDQCNAALRQIEVSFQNIDGENLVTLNGEAVENKIRTSRVANDVSEVAALPSVRDFLKLQQQQMGADKGIVMDGRDIGTIIFPDAELKLFVTADIAVRARRRFEELLNRGSEVTLKDVRENLAKRDKIDSNRTIAPLIKAEHAVEIDNSNLNKDQQLALALRFAESRIKKSVAIPPR